MDAFASLVDGSTPVSVETWHQHLHTFATTYQNVFDLSAVCTGSTKARLITYLTSINGILNPEWNEPAISSALSVLKILTRTRTDLEPMMTEEFLSHILTSAHHPPSAWSSTCTLESLRILLNLIILSRETMLPFIAKHPKWIDALVYVGQHDPTFDIRFTIIRLGFFLTLNDKMASDLVKKGIYQLLAQTIMCPTAALPPDTSSDSSNASSSTSTSTSTSTSESTSTSTSSSSSTSTSTSSDCTCLISPISSLLGSSSSAIENRRMISEALRVLVHLAMEPLKRPSMKNTISAHLYQHFCNHLVAILAAEVEIPSYAVEPTAEYDSDDEESASIEQVHIDDHKTQSDSQSTTTTTTETSTSTSSTSTSTSSSTATTSEPSTSNNTNPATEDISSALDALDERPRDDEAEKKRINEVMAKRRAEREAEEARLRNDTRPIGIITDEGPNAPPETSDPSQPSIIDVKRDIAHLIIYSYQYLVPFLITDMRSIQALVFILHRQCIAAARAPRSEREAILSPILTALGGIVHDSIPAARHVKRCVFKEYADARKHKNVAVGMAPQGAINEKEIDTDPLSLKSLLIKHITSLNVSIKQLTSELLFDACGRDAQEFMRLVGFGNAAGLLAEKGIPGFGGLSQKSINLDDLVASGKKL